MRIKVRSNLAILLMDGNTTLRSKQIEIFKKIGFKGKVYEASSCESAKKFSDEYEIEFFILDWNTSDQCALTYLKSLRESDQYKNTPIMMLSNKEDLELMISAIDNGVSSYVVKPISIEEYIEAFQLAFEKHIEQ